MSVKRNSDESLRRAEREYAATRDDAARLRLIQERLRRGVLDPMRVRLAAAFGDEQAVAVGLPKLKAVFSVDDHARAAREGWGFFDSDTYGLEIQLDIAGDDLEEGREPYRSDGAVHADLVGRARNGGVFAMKALLEIKRLHRAAYQETIAPAVLHRLLKESGVEYADYAADSSGWDLDKIIPKRLKAKGAALESHAERDLIDSFLGLLPMRKNPDEDIRALERAAQTGGLVDLERWLAARRRKEPKLFEQLAAGEEPEVSKRLILARIDEGRPNAERERWWLYWIGFGPAKDSFVRSDVYTERPRWGHERFDVDLANMAGAHPVLTGFLSYEIVDQEVNVETNGYELATSNTALVDRLMKAAGRSLLANWKEGLVEPKLAPAEKFHLKDRRALQKIVDRGEEAIEEDLETVTYGSVTYGVEALSQFPCVARAVLALSGFAMAGRPEDLRTIGSTVVEMRGMEYFSEDEFAEFVKKVSEPVIRRVLESGPVLGQ
jgi:hypothetical protein